MRKFLLLLFVLINPGFSQSAEYEISSFYITSNCIEEALVEKSKLDDGWVLILHFTEEGAKKINKFSKAHNGKLVNFIFKGDSYEFKTKSIIREELSDQMQIEGIVSNQEVFKVQDNLHIIKGECGVRDS